MGFLSIHCFVVDKCVNFCFARNFPSTQIQWCQNDAENVETHKLLPVHKQTKKVTNVRTANNCALNLQSSLVDKNEDTANDWLMIGSIETKSLNDQVETNFNVNSMSILI